jgi:succinate dehydrogenase/fumarate reductase flavoprotein subunit
VPDLVVAGAGMAGLAAAAEARARGADVLHLEKGSVAGGAMRWSSGVVWRHRAWEDFRRECPDGDPALQRLVFERLDADLDWLESRGATVTQPSTGNPRTVGRRFEPGSIVAALAGEIELGAATPPPGAPVILATGGFAASPDLRARHITSQPLLLRSTPWSTGDGLRLGLAAGARLSAGMGEFYGRAMPAAPLERSRWITDAQLYARHASVRDADGSPFTARTWSEIDVVQWLAQRPGARGWFTVDPDVLGEPTPYGTVAEQIDRARAAGATVRTEGTRVSVEVQAAITTTLGGLAVDATARAAEHVWAAGADAGGVATGGYASGLAAALVLGRTAGAAALEVIGA